MIYVFHENQVTEHPTGEYGVIYPVGSYILEYLSQPTWYKKILTSCVPINQCDIPDWVKALCLIGGVAR